jgi:hypothetical protein
LSIIQTVLRWNTVDYTLPGQHVDNLNPTSLPWFYWVMHMQHAAASLKSNLYDTEERRRQEEMRGRSTCDTGHKCYRLEIDDIRGVHDAVFWQFFGDFLAVFIKVSKLCFG